jgi:transposase
MKIKKERKAKLQGLDIIKLEKWIQEDEFKKATVKCQIIISLLKNNSVKDVCRVFDVTREGIRIWKNIILTKGPNGLISQSIKGRKPNLSPILIKKLKKILSKPPYHNNIKYPKWTGKILVDYLMSEYNISVTIRTAQLWMKKIV